MLILCTGLGLITDLEIKIRAMQFCGSSRHREGLYEALTRDKICTPLLAEVSGLHAIEVFNSKIYRILRFCWKSLFSPSIVYL